MQKKILNIEDDPARLETLSSKLKSQDFTAVETKDGGQALIRPKQGPPTN